MKYLLLSAILLFSSIVSACSESVTDSGSSDEQTPPPASNDDPNEVIEPKISITVDWQELTESLAEELSLQAYSESVTHFAVRLVYEEENAVYTQSAEKGSAEENGLITLAVPPTERAQLYAVAVQHAGGMDNYVQLAGAMYDIRIEEGTEYDWSVGDFEWMEPTWGVDDEYQEAFDNGQLTASKDDSSILMPVYTRHPFLHPLLRLNGTSSGCDLEEREGYYAVCVSLINPEPGSTNVSEHRFWPYLDSSYFNLPEGGRYAIEKQGEIEVHWQVSSDDEESNRNDQSDGTEQQERNLIVTIDWDQLESSSSLVSLQESSSPVTHFSARILHHDTDQAFVQSISRASGRTNVEMDIPAGESLDLWVVAVDDGPEPYVRWMGTLRNQSITNETRNLNLEDIDWVVPEWSIADSLQSEYESGTFTAEPDENQLQIPYSVSNPFDLDPETPLSDRSIRHNGTSGTILESEGGIQTLIMFANKPEESPTEETVEYRQFPYLDATLFDLPDRRYIVGQRMMEYSVQW